MKKIIIITGGSGGHVVPALNMYDHLKKNFNVQIISDSRGSRFINKNIYNVSLLNVPNLFSNIYFFPIKLFGFFFSIIKSIIFIINYKPDIVISTGGYMCIPFSLATYLFKKKLVLFEPNSVLGRTNKLMLKFSKNIICYNDDIKNFPNNFKFKISIFPPILRKELYEIKKNKNQNFNDIKKILVIGGSQGAKFFDKEITKLLVNISASLKIEVMQQVTNNLELKNIRDMYQISSIRNTLFKYENDLFRKYSDFDFVITRAGASTISELAYLNIPFMAIPLPSSKDNHQFYNAKFYYDRNSCWMYSQKNFNLNDMSNIIINIFSEKKEYFNVKDNLSKITNQNTWNNINKKLIELINEN